MTVRKKRSPKAGAHEMDLNELERAVREAAERLEHVRAALPELANLTGDERQASIGRLREGEADALRSVFDAVDAYPAYFSALAAKDYGDDDQKVETAPARDALAKADAVAALASQAQHLAEDLADTVLELRALAREVSVGAYGIARAVAAVDPGMKSALAKALNFYGAPARARLRRRKDKTLK